MLAEITPFYVMEAMIAAEKLQRQGADVIHLSVGQPSAQLPAEVIAHGQAMLAKQHTGYTHSLGIEPLRGAIAQMYMRRYGVSVPVTRIAVTVGSSVGAALALMAAFGQGDNVGIGIPYYPAYPNMLRGLGLMPNFIRCHAADGYQLTPSVLESQAGRLQGLMLASPSNPAGTLVSPASLSAICSWCDAQGARLFSDEIYHGITFGSTQADTALRYSDQAVVINSFSKYFLMPGYRLGWVVMPEALMRRYECLLQSFVISAPTVSQYMALAMFEHTTMLDQEVHRYKANRDLLIEACQAIGFTDISQAEGAFYLYANIGDLAADSRTLCDSLLNEAHVSIVPGMDFDAEQGHRTVRFSFCGDSARLEEAIERMHRWRTAHTSGLAASA